MRTSAEDHGAGGSGGARDAAARAPKHRFVVLVVIALLVALAILVTQWAWSHDAPTADLATPTPQSDEHAAVAISEVAVADERSAAVPDGAKPSSPSSSLTARGTVVVEVYREPAIAVAGVRVLVGNEAGVTDANGRAVVSIGTGSWPVVVDEAALSRELLPPFDQLREEPGERPPGFFAREAVVTADASLTVRLRVFLATSLRGMVVDGAGVPVPDCHVRLQCRGANLVGVVARTRTRADGTYTFADARPGPYDLIANPGFDRVAPMPMRLDVAEGDSSVLPTLVVDGGRGVVRGRVIDQDGVPATGLPVLVYPTESVASDGGRSFGLDATIAWATTDANGRFVLSHLPEALLTVAVHPMGRLENVESGRRLAQHIPPMYVDLRPVAMRDLGDVIAVRSRPFTLAITVIDDEAKIRAADSTLPTWLSASDVFVVNESERNDPTRRQELHPARDRRVSWSWSCETPHEAVWVIVERPGFPAHEERVEPVPSTTRTLDIRYP